MSTHGFTLGNIAIVTSGSFLGVFAGAVAAGLIGDRPSRQRSLIYSTAWFSIDSLATAAVSGCSACWSCAR